MEQFEKLKLLLKQLPGIGEKSAERLIFSIISKGVGYSSLLSDEIKAVAESVKICSNCGGYGETNPCEICSDKKRDKGILMVLERPRDVFLFEKSKRYRGRYHILGKLISPIDGITPEKIGIENLTERIKREEIKEVILSLPPTTEGETTAIFLSRTLEGLVETVSTIARGVPFGSDFEFIDEYTLQRSIDKRQKWTD
ncbi:MAG: recombination mediator RecR [bacterium]|nr:recombination mediator RecR [bacterium]